MYHRHAFDSLEVERCWSSLLLNKKLCQLSWVISSRKTLYLCKSCMEPIYIWSEVVYHSTTSRSVCVVQLLVSALSDTHVSRDRQLLEYLHLQEATIILSLYVWYVHIPSYTRQHSMVHGCNPPKSNLPTPVVMGGSIHSNNTEICTATQLLLLVRKSQTTTLCIYKTPS